MAGRVSFKGEPLSVQLNNAMKANEAAVASAIVGTANDIADYILDKGRQDIANAGKFGPRWTEGLTADVNPKRPAFDAVITVSHSVPYFSIFQEGGTITGSPYLWIPFSYTRLKVPPRNFPGALFFVMSKRGLPMLFSKADRKPKYFGISAVTQKKRFRTLEIGEEALGKAQQFYDNRLAK